MLRWDDGGKTSRLADSRRWTVNVWLDGLSRKQHHQLVDVATGQAEEVPLPSDADVLGWASLP